MYTVNVEYSGPIWTGQANDIVEDYLDDAVWEITKVGRGDLGVQFIRVFKEPTGYYESQVEAVRGAYHTAQSHIHDGGVIYSHWLEGVGSRNFPVTRFKGYWSFKTVAQALQAKAVTIAETVLPPYLARLNGAGHGA